MEKNKKLAFPTPLHNTTTGQMNGYDYGLTLRDYFAAKALQGFCGDSDQWMNLIMDRGNSEIKNPHEYVAQQMYQIADAMLEQRKK